MCLMHHFGHESKLAPRFNHQKKKKIRSLLQAVLFWSTRARHRPDQELAVNSGLPPDPDFTRTRAPQLTMNLLSTLGI